jgi:hypothetical protein
MGHADLSVFGRNRIVRAMPENVTGFLTRGLHQDRDAALGVREKLKQACNPQRSDDPTRLIRAERLAFGCFATMAAIDALGEINLRGLLRTPDAWPQLRRRVGDAEIREFRAVNPGVAGRPLSPMEARFAVAFASLLRGAGERYYSERPADPVWQQLGASMEAIDDIYLAHPQIAKADGVPVSRILHYREAGGDETYSGRKIADDILVELAWTSSHFLAAERVFRPIARPPKGFPANVTRLVRTLSKDYERELVGNIEAVCEHGAGANIEHLYGDPKILDWTREHSGRCTATVALRLPWQVQRSLRGAAYSVPYLRRVTPFDLLRQCSKAAERALPKEIWEVA